MKSRMFLLFFMCVFFSIHANGYADRGMTISKKRAALIIGNSDYIHGGKLKNPVNDARDIGLALTQLGFSVEKFENCSQREMKKAIDKFGRMLKSENYQVGLFFYAGHGMQLNGANYLLPVDAKLDEPEDVEYDCVRADRILGRMEGAGTKTNIIILDACRDNPFERSWHRATRSKGLAFMNAPSGSLIAYATAPGDVASDGNGENGLYTTALLKHLNTPNITIMQMFQRVRSTLRNQYESSQVPWESTSLGGDFYFKREASTLSAHEVEAMRLEHERLEGEKIEALRQIEEAKRLKREAQLAAEEAEQLKRQAEKEAEEAKKLKTRKRGRFTAF